MNHQVREPAIASRYLALEISSSRVREYRIRDWAVGLVVLGAAVVLGTSSVVMLSAGARGGPVILGLFVLFCLVMGTYLWFMLEEKPPEIRGGALIHEVPVRRAKGGRARRIPLEEIVDVQPAVRKGWNGLDLWLRDGTEFFLAQAGFGASGLKAMVALSSPFGHDFQRETQDILLTGRGSQFHVLHARSFVGGTLRLRTSLRTTSWTLITVVRPGEVSELQLVTTSYSGEALLVSLGDGSRFLMKMSEVKSLHVLSDPSWREKLRPVEAGNRTQPSTPS